MQDSVWVVAYRPTRSKLGLLSGAPGTRRPGFGIRAGGRHFSMRPAHPGCRCGRAHCNDRLRPYLSFPLGPLPGFASACLALTGVCGCYLGETDAGLITIDKFDPGQFEGLPQDSKGRQACFCCFTLEKPNSSHPDTSGIRELLLRPVEQASCRPALGSRNHRP